MECVLSSRSGFGWLLTTLVFTCSRCDAFDLATRTRGYARHAAGPSCLVKLTMVPELLSATS